MSKFQTRGSHGAEEKSLKVVQCLYHTPSNAPFNFIVGERQPHQLLDNDYNNPLWDKELATICLSRGNVRRLRDYLNEVLVGTA